MEAHTKNKTKSVNKSIQTAKKISKGLVKHYLNSGRKIKNTK